MGFFDFLTDKKNSTTKAAPAVPVVSARLPGDMFDQSKLNTKDFLAPSALEIRTRDMSLGDKYTRTMFVVSYPKLISDGWFAQIINMDAVFDVAIYIHPSDTAQVLKDFQKKVAEVQAQINIREEKGLVRDPKLDSAYRDLERLRDDLMQAQEKLFDVGFYITVYADSLEKLDKTESAVRSTLEAQMIYIKPAIFQQEQGFRTTLPLESDELQIYSKLNSSPLSSFFPFMSFNLTSDKGIMYGVNRHNSSLIIFDRYSMENYNSLTFAKSGSGKSFCTKLEILRTLMFDTNVIVIDPEREYEYLAEAVGGRYFNVSLNSPSHINPFDLPIPREDENPADILRSNIINLVGLFRIMLGGLTPEEDALVDRALTETYALKDITPESDFSTIEPPLLSDFALILSGMVGGDSIAQKLSKYVSGTWAGFLNQPTTVDINQKMIVFSIRDMEDELKPVAMYIVTHHIWNSVRKELKKRLLVIDEAWWMMKSEDTASFLFSMAKRGRKYYLGLATITQDVEDFMRSPYGLAIVTNSSIQLLLKQSPTVIDNLQKVFHLTDEEKFLLLESGVGEGIFFAGTKRSAIKIIASYTEHQVLTSDPEEVLAIRKAKSEMRSASVEGQEETLDKMLNQNAGGII